MFSRGDLDIAVKVTVRGRRKWSKVVGADNSRRRSYTIPTSCMTVVCKQTFNHSGCGSPHKQAKKTPCRHLSGNAWFPRYPSSLHSVFPNKVFSKRTVFCNGMKCSMELKGRVKKFFEIYIQIDPINPIKMAAITIHFPSVFLKF